MKDPFVKELVRVIVSLEHPRVVEDFLANILTPAELHEIARRLQIFKMLQQGVPQRLIAQRLKVSIETVSRGSRELKYGPRAFQKVFAKFL